MEHDPERISQLRKIVAERILDNPDEYPEVVLGKDPLAYTQWITSANAWGGAIELAIFSNYYKTEIDSIDIATCRVDRFGQGMYSNRVVVLYSGIHYDAVALAPTLNSPKEFDTTSFSADDEEIVQAGVRLAEKLKKVRVSNDLILLQAKKFTDLANFTLKCGVCQKVIFKEFVDSLRELWDRKTRKDMHSLLGTRLLQSIPDL